MIPSIFDYHSRMLLLFTPPSVAARQDTDPAVIIEWTFQLRWACVSFFETRTFSALLPRNELLESFFPSRPASLEVAVQVNGIGRPTYGRMRLRHGDAIHVTVRWPQVHRLLGDLIAAGVAEAGLAYSLSPAPPDIFEECYMKEGRAVFFSGDGIYARTQYAHLHLEFYY